VIILRSEGNEEFLKAVREASDRLINEEREDDEEEEEE
jgi:hypothetical protein